MLLPACLLRHRAAGRPQLPTRLEQLDGQVDVLQLGLHLGHLLWLAAHGVEQRLLEVLEVCQVARPQVGLQAGIRRVQVRLHPAAVGWQGGKGELRMVRAAGAAQVARPGPQGARGRTAALWGADQVGRAPQGPPPFVSS